jgi:hypothetical protein
MGEIQKQPFQLCVEFLVPKANIRGKTLQGRGKSKRWLLLG